ncbi:MAG: glycosyltransferase, partial [Candidatus Roizmanbacteria bacterium]|nr:glycosyltransferase [Candidatus Roizmanbacteria bacterium]
MKKTIIGIDGNEANVIHKVGVSVYTLNLLTYFQSQASNDTQFIVYLRNNPSVELPKETEYFKYKVIWGPTLWSQLFLPFHLWLYRLQGNYLNVFFSPAHYIPRFCPFKTIVTIHDLSYLYFPTEFLKKDLFQLKNWTEYALKNSQHIIAVSKTTKKDIIHEYSILDGKISVIYNGYTNPIHDSDTHKHKLPYPYFLYIGTVQPRKNLNTLITAFTEFYKTH